MTNYTKYYTNEYGYYGPANEPTIEINNMLNAMLRRESRHARINTYENRAEITRVSAEDTRRILDNDPTKILVIDTETTGLNQSADDVLQLTALDGTYLTWLNLYFGSYHESWPEAQAVNHINPAHVKDLLPLDRDTTTLGRLRQLILRADVVVGYNIWYDLNMLIAAGADIPHTIHTCDVMAEYKALHGCTKWVKLTEAAEHYKISTILAHDAGQDCLMTLDVLKAMTGGRRR